MKKMFCFPYAGGLASIYHNWKKGLLPDIEVVPMELAGRGSRYNEKPYSNMEEAISDLFQRISNQLDGSPYIIFGHSMGALLAYEVSCQLLHSAFNNPEAVFLSGREPMHYRTKELRHLLPHSEFVEELIQMGGIDDIVLKEKQLMDMYIPIIRGDFKLIECYESKGSIVKLDSPIFAMAGSNDTLVLNDRLYEWNAYTKKQFKFDMFEGDHFYIRNEKTIFDYIKKSMQLL